MGKNIEEVRSEIVDEGDYSGLVICRFSQPRRIAKKIPGPWRHYTADLFLTIRHSSGSFFEDRLILDIGDSSQKWYDTRANREAVYGTLAAHDEQLDGDEIKEHLLELISRVANIGSLSIDDYKQSHSSVALQESLTKGDTSLAYRTSKRRTDTLSLRKIQPLSSDLILKYFLVESENEGLEQQIKGMVDKQDGDKFYTLIADFGDTAVTTFRELVQNYAINIPLDTAGDIIKEVVEYYIGKRYELGHRIGDIVVNKGYQQIADLVEVFGNTLIDELYRNTCSGLVNVSFNDGKMLWREVIQCYLNQSEKPQGAIYKIGGMFKTKSKIELIYYLIGQHVESMTHQKVRKFNEDITIPILTGFDISAYKNYHKSSLVRNGKKCLLTEFV